MKNSLPWDGMKRPTDLSGIASRKVVGSDLPKGVSAFWTVTSTGKQGVMLRFSPKSADAVFPSLKVVETKKGIDGQTSEKYIWVSLLDNAIADQFATLCFDVINAVCNTDARQVSIAVKTQLEKWQLLLLGKKGKLTANEQKGLIAELVFLKDYALASHAPLSAVRAWEGPLKAPRDYSFGATSIEVKSNRGQHNPKVTISSEKQLATSEGEQLVLFVLGLREGLSGEGMTLTEYVNKTSAALENDFQANQEFKSKIYATGYREEQDYSDTKWVEIDSVCYWVSDGFPRIVPSDLPDGVANLTYDLNLATCSEYLAESAEIVKAIGENNG